MTNKLHTVLLVAVLVLLGVIALRVAGGSGEEKPVAETAFERVMRTRTIRCAYGVWPPRFMLDAASKKMSGIDYEVMEAIGRVTGLKIEWDSEFAGPGVIPDQLQSKKQDVCCVALWANGRRAQRLEMSVPIDYMPLYAFVREGDKRFDNTIEAINDAGVTISLSDGSAQMAIAEGSFPKAKRYSLSQDQASTDTFLVVATGKADVVFSDLAIIHDYNARNPKQKLRRVPSAAPLKVFSNVFTVAKGEGELRDLLSAAIDELHEDGTIDRILDTYEIEPGALLRVAPPYEQGKR